MNPLKAYEILGIPPTTDDRVIRSAFLRLARIYHPDRFADTPPDVRSEAERRMKEATSAYQVLRDAAHVEAAPLPDIDEKEMAERARVYNEAVEKKRKMDEYDRARWRSWEEAERRAREKARRESEIAARLAYEAAGGRRPDPRTSAPEPEPVQAGTPPKRDRLSERLDAARRGERDPLVPLSPDQN